MNLFELAIADVKNASKFEFIARIKHFGGIAYWSQLACTKIFNSLNCYRCNVIVKMFTVEDKIFKVLYSVIILKYSYFIITVSKLFFSFIYFQIARVAFLLF